MLEDGHSMTGRAALSNEEFEVALPRAVEFLRSHGQLTNARLRGLTGLNYDQAVRFFNRAIARGILERRGRASGVHYLLVDAADT
jgi:hypothetical protein